MKLFVLSSDARGDRNPIVEAGIIRHLTQAQSMREADAVLVPICYCSNYAFNTELERIDKPIVLLDFMEYGWDAGDKPNLFGGGWLDQFEHIRSDEWKKLDAWVSSLPKHLLFKRELFERDRNEWRLPVEFPCLINIPETESCEVFNSRPIETFFNWGYSHPIRQRMHGRIFASAVHLNIHVVDSWTQQVEPRTWATIHTPHYERKPMTEVMRWQQRSKVSLSLPGAGVKCFRSAEAPVGAVVAMLEDELAWSYPWNDSENCIRIDRDCHVTRMAGMIRDGMLYDIYIQGQETIRKYEQVRYAREYVMENIKARL